MSNNDPIKKSGANSCGPEEEAVPTPHVTPDVLLVALAICIFLLQERC
jgi:hypothetical protein